MFLALSYESVSFNAFKNTCFHMFLFLNRGPGPFEAASERPLTERSKRLDGQNFVQLVVKITTPLLAGARNNLTLSDDGALIKDVLRCAVEWSAISILVPEQVENVYN